MDIERIVRRTHVEVFTPLEAAERQIDRAIALFIEERDYLCAVTLAGAAEGILFEAVHAMEKESIFATVKHELLRNDFPHLREKEISDEYLNKIRNLLKHKSVSLYEKIEHAMDLEAMQVIMRALGNFALVSERVTQRTAEFYGWMHQHRPEILEAAAKYEQAMRQPDVPTGESDTHKGESKDG